MVVFFTHRYQSLRNWWRISNKIVRSKKKTKSEIGYLPRGIPDKEKRWIERRSYFIREKAILLWICEVISWTCLVFGLLSFEHPSVLLFLLIDYFIVLLDLWHNLINFIVCNAIRSTTIHRFNHNIIERMP